MKILLMFSVMLAVTVCIPVSQDQEREKRSASDSDESFSLIYCLPNFYPYGISPPFRNQGNPRNFPFAVPFSPYATLSPDAKYRREKPRL
ncbi:Fdcsp [Phodopus roborovskii]|uniref:Fdcsp protein n=1 Tax=Phodopus roborovskii TaxID=109678 RepID=A0AAU9ZX06_PHORO|nr:Fdcsp [Phodopus roborovskii]